jgi:APA family basic amino acid/polyamine antiporter
MQQTTDTQPALKRDVGLLLLTLYGLGNIVGAGIYVLVGEVAGAAGLQAPFAFLLAAFVAGASGLSYGELSARYPTSAGEAVFIYKAFNIQALSIGVGLLIMTAGLVSAAAMARGFVGYFNEFFSVPASLVIAVVLVTLGIIAMRGIVESAKIAAVLTIIEIAGLIWVVIVAAPNLANLADVSISEMVPLSGNAWKSVMGAAFLAFFAFIGFEDMVNIAEEVKNPQRNMPRGILLAFAVATLLYLLVILVSLMTLDSETLGKSTAPLADVYRAASGKEATFISVIGLIAVLNGGLIQIIMGSRILFGMSRNGWLPKFLSTINPTTQTPIRATIAATAIALIAALTLPLVSLAQITSGLILGVFVMINISLIRIKMRDPTPAGINPVPMAVPIIAALSGIYVIFVSV